MRGPQSGKWKLNDDQHCVMEDDYSTVRKPELGPGSERLFISIQASVHIVTGTHYM